MGERRFKSQYFTEEGDHALLTPGNFWEHGGYRDRGDKQKFYVGPIPDDFVLTQGDLLMAMTEQAAGLLGSTMIVPENGTFLHNQRLGLMEPLAEAPLSAKFFSEVFNLRHFHAALQQTASGVKVRHTSPRKIGEVVVRFPNNVAEQEAVAAKLMEVKGSAEAMEKAHRSKLNDLDDLRQSLLQKAFAGELS